MALVSPHTSRSCRHGQAHLKHKLSCTFLPPQRAFLLPSLPLLSPCRGGELVSALPEMPDPSLPSQRHNSNGENRD